MRLSLRAAAAGVLTVPLLLGGASVAFAGDGYDHECPDRCHYECNYHHGDWDDKDKWDDGWNGGWDWDGINVSGNQVINAGIIS